MEFKFQENSSIHVTVEYLCDFNFCRKYIIII